MYFHWLICRQELKFGCLALISISLTYTSLCDQSSFTRLKICRTSSSLKNCLGCDVWALCSSSCHHLSLCPGSWPCFSSTSSHVGLATGCSSCQEILGLYSPCQSLEKLRAVCIWWSGSLGLQCMPLDGPVQAALNVRANVPLLCPMCSWDSAHTPCQLNEGRAPGWPGLWSLGCWLVLCEMAMQRGLLVHVLHTFYSTIFSLISCVFLRNLAKSALIPLCFILKSKGSNHLQLIFGGRKSLQTLLWPTLPVFLSSSTYCQCGTGRWVCGVLSNHRKMRSKVSPWEGKSIPGHPFSWELEQYNPYWSVMSTAGKTNGLCCGFSSDRTAIHYLSMLPLLWMILCLKQLI